MAKPIIIGYDPGTTAALAIVDTGKNVLYLKSKKEFKRKEIVEAISKKGRPIIVAGDKNPLSKNVDKLASSFGCKAFEPSEDLSNLEKYNLVRSHMDLVKNDHQRDALASALKAHKNYSSLFRKTDKTIAYLGLSEFYDKILTSMINDDSNSINDAVNNVLSEIREKKEKVVEKKKNELKRITPEEMDELRKRLRGQENDIKILKKYNETLKKKLEKSDKIYLEQKEKSDKFQNKELLEENGKINRFRGEIEKRNIAIEKLKELRKLEMDGYVPIMELKRITQDNLKKLHQMFGIEGRVLSTQNQANILLLNDYKLQALILPEIPEKEIFERVNFPIILKDDINQEDIGDVAVSKKKHFDEKLKKARKSGFIQWINGHKKRRL